MKMLFDIIVSGPGMDEQVKLNITSSRKVILLLCEILENGLQMVSSLKESVGQEGVAELGKIKDSLLEKSNLKTLASKLSKVL